jgi:hypothetical protein
MSTDFVPTLVEDDRLILTDKLPFEVYQGASSISPQVFAANTQTGSSHTYTVTVPSYESITDMNILWDGDITYTITGVPPDNKYLVNYGNATNSGDNSDCLAPFPFLQNIIVASATINQSQVSVNCQDVLPALLPCIARDSLSVYNSMTPTMLDNVQSYTYPSIAGYVGSQASVFAPYSNSNDWKVQPRGAWKVKSISGNTIQSVGAAAVKTVAITFHVTEPLGVLSPFLFAKPGGAGIAGVMAINFNLTLDATGSRSWRTTSALANYNVSCSYADCKLLVNFLSPKASQLVKYAPKNILPYSQLQVYKSNPQLPTNTTLNSPSIQLSSIPKMALLFVRPTVRTYNTPDFVLPITKLTINFNGRNGLLSGATQQQIFAMSCLSGVQQSWQEWSGSANWGGMIAPSGTQIGQQFQSVFTQGGICALTWGRDLEISDQYSSVSSIGQFNFAVNVTFDNSCGYADNVELYIVLVNEGFMASERGQSSTYT